MADRAFVDTNLLVYADDSDAGDKQTRARTIVGDLIAQGRAVISTQVLQEYFVSVTQKLSLPPDQARRRVEVLSKLDVVVVRSDLILGAIDLHRLHGISFWDALIVRCASSAGCSRVLSEDLNEGQRIDGVVVENPFRQAKAET